LISLTVQRFENIAVRKNSDSVWKKSIAEGLLRSYASGPSPNAKYVMTILHFGEFE